MSLVTPPVFHSLVTNEYLAREFRRVVQTLAGDIEGTLGAADLAVSATSPTSMSVNVAAGRALINGDTVARQGAYFAENDGVVVVGPHGAAHATLPRIDLVILRDYDASPDGGSAGLDVQRIEIVAGSPNASPVAPALPANAIPLAEVLVGAAVTTITAGNVTDRRPRLSLGAVPLVTALPTTPQDGQVVDYLADATNGVIWRLRYRAAATGAYKWEVIGGAPLFAANDTAGTMTGTSYADPTTGGAGPSVTVPLAGDYLIRHGLNTYMVGAGVGYQSFAVGATAAQDADSITYGSTASGASLMVARLKTAVPAASAIAAKFKVTASTMQLAQRWLEAMPRRVG